MIAQTEQIDLQGIFKGKYRYDRVKSLTWRPTTSQYTYYNDADDAMMATDVKNGKEVKLFAYSQLYNWTLGRSNSTKTDFNNAGGKVSTAWEWIDQNSFKIYAIHPQKGACYITYNPKIKQFFSFHLRQHTLLTPLYPP